MIAGIIQSVYYGGVMYKILLLIGVISLSVSAQQSSELSVDMKNIGLSYKKVMHAENKVDLLMSLEAMATLISNIQKEQFKPDLQKQSIEGLEKVLSVISVAKKYAENDDIKSAKKALERVDRYRKEYHKLHEPPSIWQLLFG